ncbi:GTP pyrophosphokinase [Clostridium perfringens]|nr:hypothetical protein [Clostridium perfringens]
MTKNVEIEKWYSENEDLYKKLIEKCKSIIEDSINDKNITVNSISGRVKEKESYCEKASKEKYKNPIKEITDMAGIRIIAYVNSDVDRICKIIENEFDVDKENSVNKGELLGIDRVGYKSVHYVVKMTEDRTKLTEYNKFKDIRFEIQIRTLLQHAWSEIEHDRNYKFSGVLPEDIKREFALLSGTLELVDIHFENISKKIDNYSKEVAIKLGKNNLESLELNSESIIQYLKQVFANEINNGILEPKFYGKDDVIINELTKFGIKNIKDLKNLMKFKFNYTKDFKTTFIGALRDSMIKADYEKYFNEVYNNGWSFEESDIQLYNENDIDLIKIIKKFNMYI